MTDNPEVAARRLRPPSGPLSERARLEAFSDGVFAIAITLLVLDLHAPTERGRMLTDLRRQWPSYLAYLASFAFIGVLWVNHHQLFTRIRSVDSGLLFANLSLLLTSSVLPFPTSVVGRAFQDGDHADQVAAVILYAGLAGITAATWLILFQYLKTHPVLLVADTSTAFFANERRRAAIGIASYTAAGVLSVFQPLAALAICATLPGFYAITSAGWSPANIKRSG